MIKLGALLLMVMVSLNSSAQIADNFTRLKLKGFPGCALKVLNKYPGRILTVEAERTKRPGPKLELFYEFDIKLKEDGRVVEIECDPNSLKLSDFEEQVGLKDERFSERALISLEKAKFILREKTKGMIVEYETSLQDGRPVYEFDVFESDVGIEVEYEIDAETGLFLESEIELFEIGNP
tara:strand:- start:3868 stop:4407 length:540 start_codon:yes stop_codon:yes gene_type:complete